MVDGTAEHSVRTIRYPKHIGTKHYLKYELDRPFRDGHTVIPKGTTVMTWQTRNFGFMKVLDYTPPTGRTLFKW